MSKKRKNKCRRVHWDSAYARTEIRDNGVHLILYGHKIVKDGPVVDTILEAYQTGIENGEANIKRRLRDILDIGR